MNTVISTFYRKITRSLVAQRLVVGASWSVLGTALARLATLVGTVIIVRLLGKDLYGQFAILQSTLAMVGVFAGLGMGITATKYIAELRDRNPDRLARILVLTNRTILVGAVLMATILALGSNIIATRILNTPQLTNLIMLASVAVIFDALDGYQHGAMLGFEAVRQSALGTFGAAVVSIPVSVALTVYLALPGAVIGLVMASMIRWATSFWLLSGCIRRSGIPRRKQGGLHEWKTLRDFTLPALLSGIMVMPAHWICHAMLVNAPNGQSEMAVLGVVNQWFYAVLFLPLAAGRIVLPVLTDAVAGQQAKQSGKVLLAAVLANFIVVLPFSLLIAFMSRWVMGLYGEGFSEGWFVLVLSMCAASLSAVFAPVGYMLAAKGKMWIAWAMNLGWAITYICATYLLLDLGARGVVTGLLIAYMFHAIWVSSWAWRILNRMMV